MNEPFREHQRTEVMNLEILHVPRGSRTRHYLSMSYLEHYWAKIFQQLPKFWRYFIRLASTFLLGVPRKERATHWFLGKEGLKRNFKNFGQRTISPSEMLPEVQLWHKVQGGTICGRRNYEEVQYTFSAPPLRLVPVLFSSLQSLKINLYWLTK